MLFQVSAYKAIVTMQEKVIAKLEMLMAGRRSSSSAENEYVTSTEKIAH